MPATGLQLRSLVTKNAELELSLVEVPVPEPAPDEVIVRVEATPISPSDLALLFGAADMRSARSEGTPERPKLIAPIPEKLMRAMSGRVDQSLPVGNEGAGVVVSAGSAPEAQALLGKKVALSPGGMYAEYRAAKAAFCMPLPDDASCADGASSFVNPLTALGMIETMRAEGHTALVHTAAASNLGQMLQRLCLEENIPLVNIVRKPEQEETLRALGAKHVLNSTAPDFLDKLTEALVETGATLAFDAIGGGKLASQILTSMEAAASRKMKEYSRYGSAVHKQVYIYGMLDRGPTELTRSFGLAWGVGGWLLTPFLQRIGPAGQQKLRARVAAGLKTTFKSQYTREISLAEALSLDAVAAYGRLATGGKFLINPTRR